MVPYTVLLVGTEHIFMDVYRVEEDNLTRISKSALSSEAALERRLVRSDGIELGGLRLMWIGRQDSPGDAGIFDILALDENGDPVVVELKRGRAPRDIVTQALEYASEIRGEEYIDFDKRYEEFLTEHDKDDNGSLRQAHKDFFCLEEELDRPKFNTNQRIVLVGESFRNVSLSMTDLLRDHGLDVSVVEYDLFGDVSGEEILQMKSVRKSIMVEDSVKSTSTEDKTDYSSLLMKVRDKVFPEIKDELKLDSPEELCKETRKRRFTGYSNDDDCPDSAGFSFIPRIKEEGYVKVAFNIWDEKDDSLHREMHNVIVAEDMDGFETSDRPTKSMKVAQKNLSVEEERPLSDATIDQVSDEYVSMVQTLHGALVDHFEGEDFRSEEDEMD